MNVTLAAIRIAHTVVNNTKFPNTTMYTKVAAELKVNGHWNLIQACNDPVVLKNYDVFNIQLAVDTLFSLYPDICKMYQDYHKNCDALIRNIIQ